MDFDENNLNVPESTCGRNLERAIEKIRSDSRLRPVGCCIGPTGPAGA